MSWPTMLWLGLMIGLLVFEAATVGLHAIWFALGAMAAAICASLGLPWPVQVIAFIVVSVATLALLRPMARRMVTARKTATNADRVLEMIGVVTEPIDNIIGQGAVAVDGKTWTARSYTGYPIEVDTYVSIRLIEGVKLIVEPAKRAE